MNNKIKITGLAILLIVMEVGRFVLSNQASQITDSGISNEMQRSAGLKEIYDLQFSGAMKTSDNPWGITAGEIDIENEGQCIFLMPGTSASFRIEKGHKEGLVLSAMIHPWVREKSNGVEVTAELYGAEDDTPLMWNEFRINASEEVTEKEIDISGIEADEIKIVLTCNVEDNQDADWVVVKQVSV